MSDPASADVDPYDAAQVAAVLTVTLRATGAGGLGDLLARIPGVRFTPAVAKGFLRAAVPASVSIGTENHLVLDDPVVHQHVVGGVVLSRSTLGVGSLPDTVARLIGPVVRDAGGRDEASIALTAARDAYADL